jgi:hypothetical protein
MCSAVMHVVLFAYVPETRIPDTKRSEMGCAGLQRFRIVDFQ